jgi:SOS-response transcriptional repressor LexA
MEFTRVQTRTSGFSSPASDYVRSRLSIEGIKIEDPYFTFFFSIGGGIKNSIVKTGDILVVNRKKLPQEGDICLGISSDDFVLYRKGKGTPEEHWGVVVLILPGKNG